MFRATIPAGRGRGPTTPNRTVSGGNAPEAAARPRALPAGRPGRAALLFASFVAALVLRRPDALFHAAFWAEDGWRWYPDAYRSGFRCLGHAWTGYLQTFPRLVALAALPLPLAWAPTLFALVALLVQAGVALLLASRRLRPAVPNDAARLAIAIVYLLLPNSFEVAGNLTNTQWHLALGAFLVLAAAAPRSGIAVALDTALLLLCGLTGPFALFLLPVAIMPPGRQGRPTRTILLRASIVAAAAVLEGRLILGTRWGGFHPPLGASVGAFADIVALQVVAGLTLGRHAMPFLLSLPAWRSGFLPDGVALGAAALFAVALVRGGGALRSFALFAGLLSASALTRPLVDVTNPAWPAMTRPDAGDRYYVVPMLAFACALLTLATGRRGACRAVARCGLVGVALVALPGDLHFGTDFPIGGRTDFVARARAFSRAPAGTTMAFPVHPAGARPMVLTKGD